MDKPYGVSFVVPAFSRNGDRYTILTPERKVITIPAKAGTTNLHT
jgi:hypothetical protein